MIDIETVLQWTAIITSAHAIYSALELLSIRDRYRSGGTQDWKLVRTKLQGNTLLPILKPFLARFTHVLLLRLVTGVVLASHTVLHGVESILPAVMVGTLFATDILLLYRHQGGLSGAFHMSLVVNAGLLIALATPSNSILTQAGILFIASQGILGYFISGIAKVKGKSWRSGHAIMKVLSTRTWGHPRAYALFKDYPTVLSVGTLAVVFFEIIFLAILFVDPLFVIGMLALAALMHLTIALTMGINGFLTSFSATYPSILYTSMLVPNII